MGTRCHYCNNRVSIYGTATNSDTNLVFLGYPSADNYWIIGRNSGNVGANNLAIGNSTRAVVMQLNQNGDITISKQLTVGENAYITTLQVNQNSYFVGSVFLNNVNINDIYQRRPWISCLIKIAGSDVSVHNQRGQKTAIANYSGNMFNISWVGAHPDGAAYIAQYCLYGSVGMIYQFIDSSTSTGLSIITTTFSGTAFGKDFYLTIF